MKITAIEPLVCDGGLREFGFLKVSTDEGIVGWAETYDWHTSAGPRTRWWRDNRLHQSPVNGAIASAARSRSASVL